jgi:hydrogenase expression/formation protein HypC
MCLGIPALVLERDGDIGKVDFGGTLRQVNLSLVDAKVGDYVIVHAGYAIQLLDEKDARETLELFREVYGVEGGEREVSGSGKAARNA